MSTITIQGTDVFGHIVTDTVRNMGEAENKQYLNIFAAMYNLTDAHII